MNGLPSIINTIATNANLHNDDTADNDIERVFNEVQQRYPELDYFDQKALAKAILTNEYCASCDGSQCEKTFEEYTVATYSVTGNEVTIRYGDCPLKKKLLRQRRREAGQRYAQIPARFRNMTANEYIRHSGNALAIEAARKVIEDEIGMYLHGAPGVGKSLLASIVASQALKAGKSVFFADVPTTLAAIKISFNDPTNTAAATVEKIIENDLVVLDDLGAERVTDWASEQIFRILNSRYNNDVPTIITSNFDLQALYNQMGGSYIASRICRRIFDTMTVVAIKEEGTNVVHI